MKKVLFWILAITLIVLLNNPQWLSFVKIPNIDIKNITIILSGVWLVLLMIVMIIIYIKYDKEYKLTNIENIDYKIAPFFIEYINKKYLTKNSFVSSIYLLIKKGVFLPRVISIDNKHNDYIFLLNKEYDFNKLTKQEKYLKDFLTNQVGNNNYWTLDMLEGLCHTKKGALYFNNIYTNYKDEHVALVIKENILERKSKSFYNLILWLGFIGCFLSLFTLISGFNYYIGFYLLATCIGFMFYNFTFTKLNKTYLNIKQYYNDLSIKIDKLDASNKYEINDVNIWEEYLIYSIVLNKNKKVESLIKEMVKDNNDYFDSDLFLLSESDFSSKLDKVILNNVFISYTASFIPVGLFSGLGFCYSSGKAEEVYNEYFQYLVEK